MILIADGGSTKADWISIDINKNEVFRVRTHGLNPAIVAKDELKNRIINMFQLIDVKDQVSEIHFYGAGCGTPKPTKILKNVLESIFTKAKVFVSEDMLAAVYAAAGQKPSIVSILGTGSNSCFFDGVKMHTTSPSLGYTVMDEASGNYFGKILLKEFFYSKMPNRLSKEFKKQYNLDADFIKKNLYRESNPNMYLATFAKFMFDFKEDKYIKKIIKKGFKEFFKYRILPFSKTKETPIYFIGSIAFYFREILEQVAEKYNLRITNIIQRPIDNLLEYHKKNIN